MRAFLQRRIGLFYFGSYMFIPSKMSMTRTHLDFYNSLTVLLQQAGIKLEAVIRNGKCYLCKQLSPIIADIANMIIVFHIKKITFCSYFKFPFKNDFFFFN